MRAEGETAQEMPADRHDRWQVDGGSRDGGGPSGGEFSHRCVTGARSRARVRDEATQSVRSTLAEVRRAVRQSLPRCLPAYRCHRPARLAGPSLTTATRKFLMSVDTSLSSPRSLLTSVDVRIALDLVGASMARDYEACRSYIVHRVPKKTDALTDIGKWKCFLRTIHYLKEASPGTIGDGAGLCSSRRRVRLTRGYGRGQLLVLAKE